jgi:hypothetical protein
MKIADISEEDGIRSKTNQSGPMVMFGTFFSIVSFSMITSLPSVFINERNNNKTPTTTPRIERNCLDYQD